MKKVKILFIFIIILILSSCNNSKKVSPSKTITLNLWHNYGGQMKSSIDTIINDFNETEGKKKGIFINVTSVASSAILNEKLIIAANDEPGSPKLPDISTIYPNTAIKLAEKGLLTNIEILFSEDELSLYIPQFIDEGRLLNNQLLTFPIAKSTEVLFLNSTIFNRFIKDSNISYNDLSTFEGILKAAEEYYKWTDNLTPEINNDGKTFLAIDSIFNLFQVAYQQVGESFILNSELNLNSSAFEKLWNLFYISAVKGYVAIYDGYGTDLFKTGDAICCIGSSAGVLFYPDKIIHSDNITEAINYEILPYPTFTDGNQIAIQRGGGFCIIKSNEEKEKAAGIFLKWFTKKEQNLKFVESTGYLPVTKDAFEKVMSNNNLNNENIKKLFETVNKMRKTYKFYIPPSYPIENIQNKFENEIKNAAYVSREEFLKLQNEMESDYALKEVTQNAYSNFLSNWGE